MATDESLFLDLGSKHWQVRACPHKACCMKVELGELNVGKLCVMWSESHETERRQTP